jgi:hypothetical protein
MNTTAAVVGNSVMNSVGLNLSGVTIVNTTAFFMGSTSVNTYGNSTTKSISNPNSSLILTASTLFIGNASVNVVINSTVYSGTSNNTLFVNGNPMSFYMPPGFIGLWYGAANAIPSGWGLCNGATYNLASGAGTIASPNLVDKFVIAAGNSYAVGAVGGAASVTLNVNTLPSHAHSVYDPGHVHSGGDSGH